MKFIELPIQGAYLIEREDRADERGFFARTYCREVFARHGIDFKIKQASLAVSHEKGTLRGMHYQRPPHQEVKLISCVRGAIFDCIVDLRTNSPTYLRHVGVTLPALGPMLYVPKDFAHGYQTLEDDTAIQYQVGAFYAPDSEGGLRWNDPILDIEWPECERRIISDKDESLPLLEALP